MKNQYKERRRRRTRAEMDAAAAADPVFAAWRAAHNKKQLAAKARPAEDPFGNRAERAAHAAAVRQADRDYLAALTGAELAKELRWQAFLSRVDAYRKQQGLAD